MNRMLASLLLGLSLPTLSCSHVIDEPTVETQSVTASHSYLGDGMEVRCYRVMVDDEELDRAMEGLGATLISGHALSNEGIQYYDLPSGRIEDLASVISEGNAWHVRWFGQQFKWSNLLPGQHGSVSLPGRAWSTMLEDGPAVHFEAIPVVQEQDGPVVREDLRLTRRLRPGHCLLLMSDDGVDGSLVRFAQDDEEEPPLGQRIFRFNEAQGGEGGEEGGRDVLVLLPRFSNARSLPPLRSPQ